MSTEADVTAWLRAVVQTLEDLEEPVRRDEADAVHRARTQTRRLRVMLPLIPGAAAKQAGKRLNQYAGLLGAARDLEVRAELAAELLREVDPTGKRPDADATRARLVDETSRARRRAHEAIVAYLDGPRYRHLVTALHEVLAQEASVDELAVLHAARKSARALRYLAEAYGDTEKAAVGEEVQDALGVHRDNTLLARTLEGEEGVAAAVREAALKRADALVSKTPLRDG